MEKRNVHDDPKLKKKTENIAPQLNNKQAKEKKKKTKTCTANRFCMNNE